MSKGENNRYHHFIPQLYLKRFGHQSTNNPKHYFVYCFDKISGKEYPSNVDEICGEDYFYKLSNEFILANPEYDNKELLIELEYFRDNVEPAYLDLLKCLDDRCTYCAENKHNSFLLEDDDKLEIAKHIIIQFLRLPYVRNSANKMTEDVLPKMIRLFKYGLAKEKKCPELSELSIGYRFDPVANHAQITFMNGELVDFFARSLCEGYWTFLYSPEEKFMTCDCPILIKQHSPESRLMCMGLTQYGSELYFVFSPKLAVQIYERSYFNLENQKDGVFGEVTQEGIDRINMLNYCHAKRRIISKKGDFSFVKFLHSIKP